VGLRPVKASVTPTLNLTEPPRDFCFDLDRHRYCRPCCSVIGLPGHVFGCLDRGTAYAALYSAPLANTMHSWRITLTDAFCAADAWGTFHGPADLVVQCRLATQ
jgi:hypothetical protein